MTTALIPQSFWFRLAIPCNRVEGLPKSKGARLLDLPPSCRIIDTVGLEGKPAWAEIRAAWNPQGLALQVEAEGTLDWLGAEDRPEGVYGLQLWVDTRDTRDVNRATRFCHRFDFRLGLGPKGKGLKVAAAQRPIARAVAESPIAKPENLLATAERLKKSWRLEVFVEAAALHGFDPDTNRRLGFAYQVGDPERDDQFLGVGREFPIGENPSLWSILELRDA